MGAPTSLLIHQAAELLGVSRRTVYYRIHEGRLRTIRTRCGSQRVLIESVEALLREMRLGRSAVRADPHTVSDAETPRL
jgi:excisionase family DNA binding protein